MQSPYVLRFGYLLDGGKNHGIMFSIRVTQAFSCCLLFSVSYDFLIKIFHQEDSALWRCRIHDFRQQKIMDTRLIMIFLSKTAPLAGNHCEAYVRKGAVS